MRRALVLCILVLCAFTAAYGSQKVILIIKEVPDDFFDHATAGVSPGVEHGADSFTVVGRFAWASFSIPTTANVAVYDASSRQIPLIIEESSIQYEFDEVVQLRFAFEIDRGSLAAGPPELVWGEDVSANNVLVDVIPIDAGDKGRYKTFGWEEAPSASAYNPQVATLEVVVEDEADIY
jgi:hypothetical protein